MENRRSQWPPRYKARVCGLSPADIVGSNPTGGMDVCCVYYVLSGRGLCNGLIIRPEESYRLWCVVMCDLETSWMRRPWPTGGRGGGCCVKIKRKWKKVLDKLTAAHQISRKEKSPHFVWPCAFEPVTARRQLYPFLSPLLHFWTCHILKVLIDQIMHLFLSCTKIT